MYDWLSGALEGQSSVITANRRLARVLREEHARAQLAQGKVAWESPRILSWPDWLETQFREAAGQAELPTRINAYHSRLLWERCLKKEIGDDAAGLANLVRLSRDALQRLADWQVSIREVARSAQSADQRMFAAAAGRYLGILEREHWVDDAGLVGVVLGQLEAGRIEAAGRFVFAGFDRERPALAAAKAALGAARCAVERAPEQRSGASVTVRTFESGDAELRGAGAWAREVLRGDPAARIAIVVSGLEREAARSTDLVREGFVPGWQVGPASLRDAVNVSYGKRLVDYPVVSIALLALRWILRDLPASDVGHLLRSPLLGSLATAGRSRLELLLRQAPDRAWSPSMVTGLLRGADKAPDAAEWLERTGALALRRRGLPPSNSPANWAIYVDEALRAYGWPGEQGLDSRDFQVVNRWRDLLNDLARMDLVAPRMSFEQALRQLEVMAADILFQPESEGARVQVLGALEAAGSEFDAICITGLTAANWPPPSSPSPLLSRRLQEQHGMPDAVPDDTVAHSERLLAQLSGAAGQVRCTFPLADDDAEQMPSAWLGRFGEATADTGSDPGRYAAGLVGQSSPAVVPDRVPPIGPGEKLSGGAGTLQRQLNDPVAAFATSRLRAWPLQPQASGVPALLRGNLVHDALYQLYFSRPDRDTLATWSGGDLDTRLAEALQFAFSPRERQIDDVLRQLFAIERNRVESLLRQLLALDQARDEFRVEEVELKLAFELAGVRLSLRVDRVDRLPDGTVAILDYKTGAGKKFLVKGEPREIQLVAYACAIAYPVGALALVNVDTREVGFNGAGTGFSGTDDWAESLEQWKRMVREACEDIARGDVRMNRRQGMADARPLALLTRFVELRND
jgi:probable DNA repair protein